VEKYEFLEEASTCISKKGGAPRDINRAKNSNFCTHKGLISSAGLIGGAIQSEISVGLQERGENLPGKKREKRGDFILIFEAQGP